MTEWERSHRDKGDWGWGSHRGRGSEWGRGRERGEIKGKGGIWTDVICETCCYDYQRGSVGLWFNTVADNNRTDWFMGVYARTDVCACVCVCMHECVERAAEHIHEVFQYSEAVTVSERWRQHNTEEGKSRVTGKEHSSTWCVEKHWKSTSCEASAVSTLLLTWNISASAELQIRFQHLSLQGIFSSYFISSPYVSIFLFSFCPSIFILPLPYSTSSST